MGWECGKGVECVCDGFVGEKGGECVGERDE